MKKLSILLSVLIVIVLILGALVFQNFSQKKAEGQACKSDRECQQGLKCVMNICSSGKPAFPCRSEKDCQSGLFCVNNKCSVISAPVNQDMFREYFRFFHIGKATEMPKDRPPTFEPTQAFKMGDYFCVEGEPLKDVKWTYEIYNPYEKIEIEPKGTLRNQKAEFRFLECRPLPSNIASGKKYEYRLYIENELVAIFPFEVREK
jgi:hypothetical protein